MHPCDEFNAKVDDGTFHQTMLCDDWTERTDSVERVALDMLDAMAFCCEYDYERCEICDYAGDFMSCGAREFFIDRLRALGIEVPE